MKNVFLLQTAPFRCWVKMKTEPAALSVKQVRCCLSLCLETRYTVSLLSVIETDTLSLAERVTLSVYLRYNPCVKSVPKFNNKSKLYISVQSYECHMYVFPSVKVRCLSICQAGRQVSCLFVNQVRWMSSCQWIRNAFCLYFCMASVCLSFRPSNSLYVCACMILILLIWWSYKRNFAKFLIYLLSRYSHVSGCFCVLSFCLPLSVCLSAFHVDTWHVDWQVSDSPRCQDIKWRIITLAQEVKLRLITHG